MQLTQTLLGFLNRVFNKDPAKVLAMQLSHQNPMSWQVKDAVLTTVVPAGPPGASLTIDLTQYTFAELVDYLASQPGYITPYIAPSMAGVGSAALLDASGSGAPGDPPQPMYAYTSVLWAYLECTAAELKLAAAQITNLPNQMSTTTADTIWLDALGTYYKVPRLPGEQDSAYGPRIIASVLRPLNNNVAIESAIEEAFGQPATVTDVWEEGGYTELSQVLGLFDVEVGYNLLGADDIDGFAKSVGALVQTLRAAGTHFRAVSVSGGVISDSMPSDATDDGPYMTVSLGYPISDSMPSEPTDSASITWTHNTKYNAVRKYDGSVKYNSGASTTEQLIG